MSSPIRELLADAQAAEAKGDKVEAARLLRLAAAQYRDANNHARALKMLRHARRLEGGDEDEDSGLDQPLEGVTAPESPPPPRSRARRELEERVAMLAPLGLDAWCSFCCRPRREVGQLVAGPAGAFICAGCVGTSIALLGGELVEAPRPVERAAPPGSTLVETVAIGLARRRLESRTGRVTLLIGPEGSGKSALFAALGETVRLGPGSSAGALSRGDLDPGDVLRVDLHGKVSQDVEEQLLTLLERGTRMAISVRAAPPKPALVLTGADGEEPLYDTRGLLDALGEVLPEAVLASVDGVVALPAPDVDALEALAVGLVATRGDLELSPAAVKQIAQLAHNSGRASHELVALLARVPKGQWKGP